MSNIKLGKEEIQKIVLGVLLGIGVVYGYFEWLLFPLQARHKAMTANIEALKPAITKAKTQVARDANTSDLAPAAQATLAQIDSMIPEGAPVAWFPPRIAEFFKTHGVDKVVTRVNTESVHPTLPGYKRFSWAVEIPQVHHLTFGAAIAELENTELLVTIENITIESLREEPDQQRVLLTLVNTVK